MGESSYTPGRRLRTTTALVVIRLSTGAYRNLKENSVIQLDELGYPLGYDLDDVNRLLGAGFLEEVVE